MCFFGILKNLSTLKVFLKVKEMNANTSLQILPRPNYLGYTIHTHYGYTSILESMSTIDSCQKPLTVLLLLTKTIFFLKFSLTEIKLKYKKRKKNDEKLLIFDEKLEKLNKTYSYTYMVFLKKITIAHT